MIEYTLYLGNSDYTLSDVGSTALLSLDQSKPRKNFSSFQSRYIYPGAGELGLVTQRFEKNLSLKLAFGHGFNANQIKFYNNNDTPFYMQDDYWSTFKDSYSEKFNKQFQLNFSIDDNRYSLFLWQNASKQHYFIKNTAKASPKQSDQFSLLSLSFQKLSLPFRPKFYLLAWKRNAYLDGKDAQESAVSQNSSENLSLKYGLKLSTSLNSSRLLFQLESANYVDKKQTLYESENTHDSAFLEKHFIFLSSKTSLTSSLNLTTKAKNTFLDYGGSRNDRTQSYSLTLINQFAQKSHAKFSFNISERPPSYLELFGDGGRVSENKTLTSENRLTWR